MIYTTLSVQRLLGVLNTVLVLRRYVGQVLLCLSLQFHHWRRSTNLVTSMMYSFARNGGVGLGGEEWLWGEGWEKGGL